MAESLKIEQANLLPSKEAAKRVGYSNDYVSRLARSKKIIATQVNRQWYVDLPSLKNYIAKSKVIQQSRHKLLSEQRKKEQITIAKSDEAFDLTDRTLQIFSMSVFAKVAMVLVLGWGVGFASWLTPQLTVGQLAVSTGGVASVWPEFFTLIRNFTTNEVEGVGHVVYRGVDDEQRIRVTHSSSSNRAIDIYFSDPIEVAPSNEQTGVIVPVFRETSDLMYRYEIINSTNNVDLSL